MTREVPPERDLFQDVAPKAVAWAYVLEAHEQDSGEWSISCPETGGNCGRWMYAGENAVVDAGEFR